MNKLTVFNGICCLATSVALVFTLSACSKNTNVDSDTLSTTSEKIIDDTSEKSINNDSEKSIEEKSNSVETTITLMLESAEELSEASEEAKQTESYKTAKEHTLDNFDTLFKFLFQNEKIAGYTISDVSDSTVQFAKDSLISLDNYIEYYIPEYKSKAKEKLSEVWDFAKEKGSDGAVIIYEEYEDIKNRTLSKLKERN